MPRNVPATEFKARCLELMDRVAETRETYVITKRGKPVARLVPVKADDAAPLFGRLRDLVEEMGDVVSPAIPARDWEAVSRPLKRTRRR